MTNPLLLGCKGWGSAIVECAFALARLALDREEADYREGGPAPARVLEVNPLGQVPALVLPGGTVLTESLAIIHYVNDLVPQAALIPPAGDPSRATFYRSIVFIVAAIYPTFTYGDAPRKWVDDDAGAAMLRESTDRHREALWKQLEAQARAPWFLGERRSAIDLYVAVMTRWRPRSRWFEENTPKLAAIAKKAAALPEIAPVMERNFG